MIAIDLGAALVLAGRLDAAAEAFSVATEQGQVAGREQPLIDALGHRALLSALRGDLRAVGRPRRAGRPDQLGGRADAGVLPGGSRGRTGLRPHRDV